jgi:hypothetical protein
MVAADRALVPDALDFSAHDGMHFQRKNNQERHNCVTIHGLDRFEFSAHDGMGLLSLTATNGGERVPF